MSQEKPTGAGTTGRDDLYREAVGQYAAGLNRLARAYEADPDLRRDLLQDIHLALWRSFERFETRCSLRTWTYRVAHNTALGHVVRQCRKFRSLLTLEQLESAADDTNYELLINERLAFEQLLALIHQLRPADRELMLLYLEGLDGPSIAEITGMSPGSVRNQIYRIKNILNRRLHQGGRTS